MNAGRYRRTFEASGPDKFSVDNLGLKRAFIPGHPVAGAHNGGNIYPREVHF